jgi:hypothetical protein
MAYVGEIRLNLVDRLTIVSSSCAALCRLPLALHQRMAVVSVIGLTNHRRPTFSRLLKSASSNMVSIQNVGLLGDSRMLAKMLAFNVFAKIHNDTAGDVGMELKLTRSNRRR